jgi:SAM-dependent methyltransferase
VLLQNSFHRLPDKSSYQLMVSSPRHYLLDTFPDEFRRRAAPPVPTTTTTLVEFWCGVGNAAWPVLELGWTVVGVDLSATAIALLQADECFIRAWERAWA